MLVRTLPKFGLSRHSRFMRPALRMFSSQEQSPENQKSDVEKEYDEISEEEKQKYRDAWGLKFDDECIKFEKEWEKIAAAKDNEQMNALKLELTEEKQRKVEFLADKVITLNIFEARYLAATIKERVQKSTGINPMKLNMDWPSVKLDADGTWPPLNPNWFKQQELMSQISPFINLGGFGGGGGGGDAASSEGQAEGEKEEKKEETKAEKTNFDIELSGFDAKNKIKLIKELRGVLNLGLKEAKEMVESAPVWLKKGMPKDEAEEISKKLEPLGAQLKIV